MKVAHVIPAVAPRYGGPSRAVIGMCRALQENGVEPLLVTTDASGPSTLAVELGRSILYQGVPAIFFARQWSEAVKYSHPLATWLNDHVKRFDLVHIHAIFSHSSLAAARACRRHLVPYVVRPLGSLSPWGLRQKRLRKRVAWHLGVKQMLHGAAAIHYTTAAERRQAEDALALTRGIVVPLGICFDEHAVGTMGAGVQRDHQPADGAPYVLVLSRLHPKKGLELFLDVLLEAFRMDELRHWRLVIAGDGEPRYVDTLKRKIHTREEEDRVRFVGWIDGREKAAVIQGAALLALPSHQENFGLSIVEAMACGVPVLVSTDVDLAEDVQEARAGWVVELDRAALLNTVIEALRDDRMRRAYGAAGRAMVQRRFTWPVVGECLTRSYRALISHRGRITTMGRV